MSFGLRIENPSGQIVLDADAAGYTYRGQASKVVNASQSAPPWGQLLPWRFQWSAPDALFHPIVAVEVPTTALVWVQGYSGSGSTWTFDVHSARDNVNGTSGGMVGSHILVQPTVHVFYPGAQAGGSYGLRLMNGSGQVTYDLSRTPVAPRELMAFPARSWTSSYLGQSGDIAAVSGDSQPIVSPTSPLLVLGAGAGGEAAMRETVNAEDEGRWSHGWIRSGNFLVRRPLCTWSRNGYFFEDVGGQALEAEATAYSTPVILLNPASLL